MTGEGGAPGNGSKSVPALQGGQDTKVTVLPILRAAFHAALDDANSMVSLLDVADTEGADSITLRREAKSRCNYVAKLSRLLRIEEMRVINQKRGK